MAPCCCVGREPEKNVALHGNIISFGIQLAQEGLFKQSKLICDLIPELLDSCKNKRG